MAPLQHCAVSCLSGAGKHPCKVLDTTIDIRNSEITLLSHAESLICNSKATESAPSA